MAVPKRRLSKSRSNKVRAGHRKPAVPNLRDCPRCGTSGLAHTVCENCGHYAGREVIQKDEF